MYNVMGKEIEDENKELKQIWKIKSNAYNSMFSFLKEKGLKEKDLLKFASLLRTYIHSI